LSSYKAAQLHVSKDTKLTGTFAALEIRHYTIAEKGLISMFFDRSMLFVIHVTFYVDYH
jgi:hypothetical protein